MVFKRLVITTVEVVMGNASIRKERSRKVAVTRNKLFLF
ncbi:MAG: hypothetical protein OFPI_03820 [Osedax symbiont Rs2]|nr:MAG: hypothetical protein OFPI_03820 [Osedax symbiont Rs2]